jgi:hypothetical protein
MSIERLSWIAAASLSRAVVEAIKGIESHLKDTTKALAENPNAPQEAREYWSLQLIELRLAIDELRDISRYITAEKWAAIKAEKP